MEDENLTQGNDEASTQQDTEAELDIDLSEDDENEIDWKAEAEKKDKAYRDQKTRAEIAEKKLKGGNHAPNAQSDDKQNGDITYMDMIAITKSNIEMEDIDSVKKFARMENISIAEALKNDELKAMLNVKAEKRNVNVASHSGASRRSNAKLSDDALLANAKKGNLPDSDEDLNRLHELSIGKR